MVTSGGIVRTAATRTASRKVRSSDVLPRQIRTEMSSPAAARTTKAPATTYHRSGQEVSRRPSRRRHPGLACHTASAATDSAPSDQDQGDDLTDGTQEEAPRGPPAQRYLVPTRGEPTADPATRRRLTTPGPTMPVPPRCSPTRRVLTMPGRSRRGPTRRVLTMPGRSRRGPTMRVLTMPGRSMPGPTMRARPSQRRSRRGRTMPGPATPRRSRRGRTMPGPATPRRSRRGPTMRGPTMRGPATPPRTRPERTTPVPRTPRDSHRGCWRRRPSTMRALPRCASAG